MRRISHIIAAAALTALGAASPALAGGSGKSHAWGGEVRFTVSVDAGVGQARGMKDFRAKSFGGVDGWEELTGGKGWALGANVGVEVGRDWAFQLEGQYLTLDSKSLWKPTDAAAVTAAAVQTNYDGQLFAGFLTGQYRIPISGYLRPYLGAGVGFVTADFGSDSEDYDWAGKFQLGADFAVTQSMSLYGQYDYIATDFEFNNSAATVHVGRFGLKKRF